MTEEPQTPDATTESPAIAWGTSGPAYAPPWAKQFYDGDQEADEVSPEDRDEQMDRSG